MSIDAIFVHSSDEKVNLNCELTNPFILFIYLFIYLFIFGGGGGGYTTFSWQK